MPITLTPNNKAVGALELTRDQDSELLSLFEDLERGPGATAEDFEYENPEDQRSSEVTEHWGQALRAALIEHRLVRSIAPVENDLSLGTGLREFLMIVPGDDIYYDAYLGEERIDVTPGSPEYAWVETVANFLVACGGFTPKNK